MNPEKTEPSETYSSKCLYKYNGWGRFLTFGLIGLIGTVIIISLGGPWYHECDSLDCRVYYDYGVYCYDYCVYSNYGPGNNVAILALVVLVFICALPLCCDQTGRSPRYIFEY